MARVVESPRGTVAIGAFEIGTHHEAVTGLNGGWPGGGEVQQQRSVGGEISRVLRESEILRVEAYFCQFTVEFRGGEQGSDNDCLALFLDALEKMLGTVRCL